MCVTCGLVGAGKEFHDRCRDFGGDSSEREIAKFRGSWLAQLEAQKLESEEHLVRLRANAGRAGVAAGMLVARLASAEASVPIFDDAGPVPHWISRVHESHAVLR